MNRLKDKVAIITGAGNGMGRSTSLLFAKEGATVAVTDFNEKDGLETVRLIKEDGGQAKFYLLDVSKEDNCKSVVDEVYNDFHKIDILVNNAGVAGVDKPTHELSEEEWDFVFNVDVKGIFFMNKHVVPYMLELGNGSIVNLSSICGLIATRELTPYHAAKGAVTLMTKRDAITYAPNHIRVNSVHPGTIKTPLVQKLIDQDPDYENKQIALHPIGYLGNPIDVSYAILFLASDEARFVTGSQLVVDGGYTAQ